MNKVVHNESNEQKWNRWLLVFRKRQFIRRRLYFLGYFLLISYCYFFWLSYNVIPRQVEKKVMVIMEKSKIFCELFPCVVLPCSRSSLRPSSMIFDLINSPHSSLNILNTHKTFVEWQVVTNRILHIWDRIERQ